MDIAGADEIYVVGGAQAIAAQMCIRDRQYGEYVADTARETSIGGKVLEDGTKENRSYKGVAAVSYTHLDVYKRQDTICDEQHPVILESMELPEPVIELAIEPKTKAGQGKLGEALVKLAEEDPTFRAHTNQETGQTIICLLYTSRCV